MAIEVGKLYWTPTGRLLTVQEISNQNECKYYYLAYPNIFHYSDCKMAERRWFKFNMEDIQWIKE